MNKIIFYIRQYSFFGFLKFLFVVVISRIQSRLPKDIYESWKTFDRAFGSAPTPQRVGNDNLIFWKIDNQNLKIKLRRSTSDFAVFNQVFISQEYDPLILLATLNNVKVNVIIDLGANIGLTSIFLKSKYPNAKIFALEPHRGNYKKLEENITLNGFTDVSAFNKAVWSKDSTVNLVNDFADQREWATRVSDSANEGVGTEAVMLESFCKSQQLHIIDILKMDIEGAEVEIFKNDYAAKEFLKNKVRLVVIELHGDIEDRHLVISAIIAASFECYFFGESLFGVNRAI